jgi:hypothetical protein
VGKILKDVKGVIMKFRFYKYRRLALEKDEGRLLDVVSRQCLWMSSPREFNDIYETRTGKLHSGCQRDLSCCTSWKQDAMWGYYADGYKGVLIEFIFDTENQENMHLYKVRYDNPEYELKRPIESGCVYKKNEWRHENEYRIIRDAHDLQENQEVTCAVNVTAIIFGKKTADETRERLKEAISQINSTISVYTIDEFADYICENEKPYVEYTDWSNQVVENDRVW